MGLIGKLVGRPDVHELRRARNAPGLRRALNYGAFPHNAMSLSLRKAERLIKRSEKSQTVEVRLVATAPKDP